MRSMWKGDISFGLLNISVKLYKATEEDNPSFNLVHAKCGNPVTQPRQCEVCGEKVAPVDIKRGIVSFDGSSVTFTDEELNQLIPENSRSIELYTSTKEQIDPIFVENVYWIEPELKSAKAYKALLMAMEKGKINLQGVVTLRKHPKNVAIWPKNGQLVLGTLRYPAEVREMPDVQLDGIEVSKAELSLTNDLLSVLDRQLPAVNPYRERVLEAVAKKGEGLVAAPKAVTPPPTDMMEALRASIARVKADKEAASKPSKKSRKQSA